jgi:hypothetical protein
VFKRVLLVWLDFGWFLMRKRWWERDNSLDINHTISTWEIKSNDLTSLTDLIAPAHWLTNNTVDLHSGELLILWELAWSELISPLPDSRLLRQLSHRPHE